MSLVDGMSSQSQTFSPQEIRQEIVDHQVDGWFWMESLDPPDPTKCGGYTVLVFRRSLGSTDPEDFLSLHLEMKSCLPKGCRITTTVVSTSIRRDGSVGEKRYLEMLVAIPGRFLSLKGIYAGFITLMDVKREVQVFPMRTERAVEDWLSETSFESFHGDAGLKDDGATSILPTDGVFDRVYSDGYDFWDREDPEWFYRVEAHLTGCRSDKKCECCKV